MSNNERDVLNQGVAIPNAGLVMLNAYFVMLFERLNLVKDQAFITKEAQLNAIHYLQYLVTGLEQTDESLLTLNKVLSGVSIATPIANGITISDTDKELMSGLLDSFIGHWNAIKNTSIDGLRGNWLIREGILKEEQDHWELTVEKRSYDILIVQSPFSFSIIKLPWMNKPLHVNWPY